jgi:hypothetical protein
MLRNINIKRLQKLVIVLGMLALVSYFLHVILGQLFYEDYNPLAQAISDLTADDSPSKAIARFFSGLYGLFSVLCMIGLSILVIEVPSKIIRFGVYLFAVMIATSAIGYALFPLSEAGYTGTFRDVMHLIVTGIVVSFTIFSLIVLIIGFRKTKRNYSWLTLVALLVLFASSMASTQIDQQYFGVAERFSVYTVVLYLGFLVFALTSTKGLLYRNDKID